MFSRIRNTLLLLVTLPGFLWAHGVSIYPVDIDIKIESNQIRARIVSDARYWLDDVFGIYTFPSARNWPESMQLKTKGIVSESFSLFLDGKKLSITSFQCRYIEEPLQLSRPKVQFDATYALPANGVMISGRSEFFKEEYSHLKGLPSPVFQKFSTRLKVSGKREYSEVLPIEQPAFEFLLSDFARTPFQYAFDSFLTSIKDFFTAPFLPFVSLLAAIAIRKLNKTHRRYGYFLWFLQFFGVTAYILFLPPRFFTSQSTVWWFAIGIASLACLINNTSPVIAAVQFAVTGFLCWPHVLHRGVSLLPFPTDAILVSKIGYLLGGLGSLVCITVVIFLFFYRFYRWLISMYESLADVFFAFNLRALSGFIFFVSLVELAKIYFGR